MGEALQDYNLVSILKKSGLLQKNVSRNKKIKNLSNEGNEQIDNKKTTTNNNTMQTQQRVIWTWYKWIVTNKCLQKKKNGFNEQDTNALLQINVNRNKKNWKPKQQVGNEQVENKKTMIKNRTMQTQTNNTGNEHDRSSKPILFASKYLVCNFSAFDTTCVNQQK